MESAIRLMTEQMDTLVAKVYCNTYHITIRG